MEPNPQRSARAWAMAMSWLSIYGRIPISRVKKNQIEIANEARFMCTRLRWQTAAQCCWIEISHRFPGTFLRSRNQLGWEYLRYEHTLNVINNLIGIQVNSTMTNYYHHSLIWWSYFNELNLNGRCDANRKCLNQKRNIFHAVPNEASPGHSPLCFKWPPVWRRHLLSLFSCSQWCCLLSQHLIRYYNYRYAVREPQPWRHSPLLHNNNWFTRLNLFKRSNQIRYVG